MFCNGFPSIGKAWSCCCLSLPWLFTIYTMGGPVSLHSLWPFLCWLGRSLWSFERCSLEDIFKLGASADASEFCEWVQVWIDIYVPHKKYQFQPHSSPWLLAACAVAIVYRNHFFRFYQKDKSFDSKVKFGQDSNRYKKVLEVAKLAYANKTIESITFQKLGSRYFW